jgi:RimJ/RimL family protein N-acetyltransferase
LESNGNQPVIPEQTLTALVRSFFREAREYGFRQTDYLRFVNALLDLAMHQNGTTDADAEDAGRETPRVRAFRLPLTGERIRIRAYDPDRDPPMFSRWLRDDAGRYFLLSRISLRRSRFEDLISDPSNTIGVITLDDGRPIGAMGFLKHDYTQHKAELRKLIGDPDLRGQGYAREATRLWIQYGLQGMGLKKIYLNTLETNLRNIRLNEELGFKVEGILRNEVMIDGRTHDVVRMGLLSPDEPADTSEEEA